ncbi:antitoxin [Streptomyces sp. NRRL F-4489]|uniref:antitoxin n=1 Tax=Streptomyces sp. NRRL F-4489 TaxID=1609095 RepID=UPI00074A0024|nr:antitoxin [Streptomyces sp. NRRL F-4489]KUL50332.1 antitoxin [Streptomyces sp. NRRL F-4489]
METSAGLPEGNAAYLDAYPTRTGVASRSAATHAAIEQPRAAELRADYAAAFTEWDASQDAAFWDRFTADGPADGVR